ncbi:PREDICTED: uncharacterized protein LOC106745745 [Dinoponera quadriceps]|uniref:Uncharacterized protein LOC106745745 n=1 Tax=Dinoponera quadriceps TaxID=609295 RepID=A0A6P3XGR9_DINQU|nr:PREDICTED: uncharacterized protein LOC106745745 [Dinoponera quadriceps]
MRISSLSVLFILVYVVAVALRVSAVPEICMHGNRQLTVGQVYIDCFVKVTCHAKGVTEVTQSCRQYTCERPSMWRGYKRFDSTKPYPDCCAGSICGDGRIIYLSTPMRSYRRPKRFIKRSPHVMGIKFA